MGGLYLIHPHTCVHQQFKYGLTVDTHFSLLKFTFYVMNISQNVWALISVLSNHLMMAAKIKAET